MTYSTPTIPSRTRFSAVIVPVLSKQQTSTRPAEGMRKGSVQKMASCGIIRLDIEVVANHAVTDRTWIKLPMTRSQPKITPWVAQVERHSSQSEYNPREAWTFSVHAQFLFTYKHPFDNKWQDVPFVQTYQLAARAKMRRKPMKRKDSKLFAETRSVEKIMVLTSWP